MTWDPRLRSALEVEYQIPNPNFEMYLYDLLPPSLRRMTAFSAKGFSVQAALKKMLHLPLPVAESMLRQGLPTSPGAPGLEGFKAGERLTFGRRGRIVPGSI